MKELRKMLPEPYNRQSREFINVLHIKYLYDGECPKDRIKEEFDKWCGIVKEFIKSLEYETRKKGVVEVPHLATSVDK